MVALRRRKLFTVAVAALSVVTPLIVVAGSSVDRTKEVRQALDEGTAKNVILLIGDGMGDSEITIARNYEVGAAGRLNLDRLPLTGAMTTYAVQEADPSRPDYVPDSAATGTAGATGTKTSNGRISTSPNTDKDLPTILELAEAASIRTGIVTTSELTDATPAVLAAHVSDRGCQGPQDMAACPQDQVSAGGPGSIAEQMVSKGVDVILGGGKRRFDQPIAAGTYAGKTVTQAAVTRGYPLVTTAAEMEATMPRNSKLLGLFSAGNMTLEWSGLPAAVGGTPPQRCMEGQRPQNEPSLAAMTQKAISLLQRSQVGRGGFFLQVEGASIDKQDHAANPCGQIGENVAFDQAVKVALDFAAQNRNTLVIVTADHAHTSQIIPVDNETSPGLTSTLITADGVEMKINYGTSPAGESQEHTGAQVRVAAQGPQAANVVGVIDQSELFYIMKRALRLP